MNCKICDELIDEEDRYDEEHEICYDCWIKDQINRYNDTDKIEVANKLLEFYFGGYQPSFIDGENWEYDGSTRDLWAELAVIANHDVEWV